MVALGSMHLAQAASATFTVDALVGGMLAGAVAGAAVDLALYPIDTIKTRMQTKSSVALELSEWRQLYAGLSSSLAGHVPSSAIFFAAYETSKIFVFQPAFGIGSPLSQIIASAVGNIAASTLRVPTEVVKTRMQSGADQGFWSCFQRIISVDGPAGLFRGYAAFLLRDLPFDTIEFVAYEQLKIAYLVLAAKGGGALEGWEAALIGAVAGGITGAVTTPLDTLRARLMNEAGEESKGGASLMETAEKILQEDGWQGLFSGVVPRVVWLSLGGTVFFSSLEAAKNVFMN